MRISRLAITLHFSLTYCAIYTREYRERIKKSARTLWCYKIATTMSGELWVTPYVPESVPSAAAELCFNFKRRRVPGPARIHSSYKVPRDEEVCPVLP